MTRTFFHLLFACSFLILSSCSSDTSSSVSEIDEVAVNVDEEEMDDFGDIDDLDVELADSAVASDDSFGDIESFNDEMLDEEFAQEQIATPAAPETQVANTDDLDFGDELDVEQANVVEPAPVEEDESIVAAVEIDASGDNQVTNLEYKSFESGGTVVISTQQPAIYNVRSEPEFNQTIIELSNVQLPQKFKLPYIAKDFGQPVATINAYQDAGSSTARIVIQYKGNIRPSVEQKNNTLLVMNSGVNTTTVNVAANNEEFEATGEEEGDDESFEVSATKTRATKVSKNKSITLEMDGVEIREVVKLIADSVNINVIIDSSVNGQTSVHLKGVPWEEALSSILKAHSLGYVRQGNILRVAPQDLLAKEATMYAERVSKEEFARRTLAPRKVKIYTVNYADVDDIAQKLAPILTTNQGAGGGGGGGAGMSLPGRAVGDKRSNAVVVTDYEEVLDRVEKVIRSLDIPPLQVLLEGKIIEANETFNKEFGLQWTANSSFAFSGKQARLQTVGSMPATQGMQGGLFSTLNVGVFDVLGDLSAILGIYESEEKIKVLSSPKVVAMNKEKAVIRQSTQLPILQTVANVGSTMNSVMFQDANLSLEVTPQVTFNGDTILDVKVQRDIPGVEVQGSRGINKRESSGKVLVKDGQTLVLGGIYNIDEASTETGIPWLKDIPILGYLFKYKAREVRKNELVIFLTPKIINPELVKKMARLSESGVSDTMVGTQKAESSGASSSDSELDEEFDTL